MAMNTQDAMKVAEIFEADDIISVPAMACRTLLKRVRELEDMLLEQTEQLNKSQSE